MEEQCSSHENEVYHNFNMGIVDNHVKWTKTDINIWFLQSAVNRQGKCRMTDIFSTENSLTEMI